MLRIIQANNSKNVTGYPESDVLPRFFLGEKKHTSVNAKKWHFFEYTWANCGCVCHLMISAFWGVKFLSMVIVEIINHIEPREMKSMSLLCL